MLLGTPFPFNLFVGPVVLVNVQRFLNNPVQISSASISAIFKSSYRYDIDIEQEKKNWKVKEIELMLFRQ